MIAWMLTRDYTCELIPVLVQREEDIKSKLEDASDESEKAMLQHEYERMRLEEWLRLYFNITAPENALFPNLRSEDRIIKLLRETDIANSQSQIRIEIYTIETKTSWIIWHLLLVLRLLYWMNLIHC